MKTKPTALLAILAILALSWIPLQAQVTPVSIQLLTVPATVLHNTTTNVAQTVEVRQGKDLVFIPSFASSNATENVIFTWRGSLDGTTWTTDTITKTNGFTEATAIVGWHRFTAAELAGLRYIQLYSIKTGSTGNITNGTYRVSWGN
jgi:hypothetical protein